MYRILTFFLVFVLVPGAGAQTLRGSISGVVVGASNRPVAASSVAVVEETTNRRRTATADAAGEFLVTSLPPGTYRVEAAEAGYRTSSVAVVLLVNQEVRVTIPLLPANQQESVTVSAVRDLLKTDSAALSTVIQTRQIVGLPLDGRNFFELSLLAPGVAPSAPGSAGSVRGDFSIHVSGLREDSNNFLLDGIYNGDPKLNGFAVNPPVDAIREFEVLTNSYDASFGRNAGGQINVVLKSGTNQVHGTVYEFWRNAALDARNYFAPANEPDPKYQRNQFGFSIGGPIRRDKTFFFSDYEGRRVREGVTRLTNVPTPAERNGDFSLSARPPINPLTRQPFPGNVIPRPFLNPVGLNVAALYPLPNRSLPGANFVSSPTRQDRDDHFDVRVDHALSSRSELAFRYSFADRSLFEPFSGPSFAAVPGFGTSVPRRAQNVLFNETHIFSPAFLNELRLGFNRVAAGAEQENRGRNLNRQVGLAEVPNNARAQGLSYLTLPGYSPLGDEFNNPQFSATNSFQVLDQASYSRGRHLVKFGFDVRLLQQNAFRDVQARGFYNFSGLLTGNPLAELLLGFPTATGAARLDNPQYLRTRSYNAFVNDTYRVRPNLTLSLGLRYEYNTPPVDARDRANIYDPARRALVPIGRDGVPRGGYDPDRNNVSPRVGLAYTWGRTVFRTGYGIYYDQASLAPGEGLYFSAPYFDFRLYFVLPTAFLTLQDPFPANFPLPPSASATAFQRNLRTPYVQHWNFNIQQQLGKSRVLEIGYVGTKGTKLLAGRDINQPRPSAQMPNPRPVSGFDDITLLESRGSSIYHGLQSRFEQRLSSGLSALASYTWSKAIDDASSFFSSAGDPNFPQDSNNVRAERARSNFDVRHRLALSYSYDLPIGRAHWYGGWQTYGIWSFQTGRPFTVALLSENDNSNTGRSVLGFGANDRPDVLGSPRLDNPSAERWFNTAAFAVPPFGTFGTAGRNILEGPGFQSINASIVKNTGLGETTTLQFRAEAFNLLNRVNLDLPDVFLGSPTFGRIFSAQSPRHLQLGLKLLF